MRKNVLGAAMPKASWCPRFTTTTSPKARRAADQLDNGPTVSLMPSWKGTHRIIPLKHYFHADMAYILEADPDVLTWDTDVELIPYVEGGMEKLFAPSIRVEMRTGLR